MPWSPSPPPDPQPSLAASSTSRKTRTTRAGISPAPEANQDMANQPGEDTTSANQAYFTGLGEVSRKQELVIMLIAKYTAQRVPSERSAT